MAVALDKEEVKIFLPWDVIEAGKGISMDIGGSAIKIIYLHKDDWKEPSQRNKSEKGYLRLVSFSREEMVEAFAYTNQNIHIIRERPEDVITVWTTGIGGSQFYKAIREAFNIDNKNIAEADCFAHSFIHLIKNLPRKDVLIDVYKPAFEHAQKHLVRYHNMMSKMKSLSNLHSEAKEDDGPPEVQYPVGYTANQDKPISEEAGITPCLLLACGSAFGGLKIEEDGSYGLATISNRGGKTFCGLGSLLTDCKTFEELMALCEKGSAGKVGLTNIQMTDSLNDEDEDSIYTAAKDDNMEETIVYYFGHAVGKGREHFKKEDMARCLLEMTIQDMVQVAHSACTAGKLKNVFFCGSFVSHPLVRQLISKEWLYRDVVMNMFMQNSEPNEQIGFHFLQQGSHLGALGAYLNSHAKFFKDPEKIGTEGSPPDKAEPAK